MSTDTITRMITTLPSATEGLQPNQNLVANVNVARSVEGKIQIILENCEPPRQGLSLRRAVLQSGVDFHTSSGHVMSNCLVLEFDTDIDSSAVAKVAEHLSTGDPSRNRTEADLLATIQMFRNLVETGSSDWNFERIIGLWGELLVLERAISLCDTDIEELACLMAWQSNGIHCKDYSFRNSSSAFDVKTTAKTQRTHSISSIDQVAGRAHDSTYLYSIMLRPVGPQEGWTVTDLINRIEDGLGVLARAEFTQIIESLNVDEAMCGAHHFTERHNRPQMMFNPSQIPGVNQFTPLPEGVPSLSWSMTLSEGGMSGHQIDDLMKSWIETEAEANENE